MTYQRTPSTVLVSRPSYSSFSSMGDPHDDVCAGMSPAQKWDPNKVDPNSPFVAGGGACVPLTTAMTAPAASSGGFLSKAGDFIGSLLGGAAKSALTPAPATAQYVPISTTPDWVMPVVIGGVGLVAILLITKKKSNPARRRRSARRR